MISKIKLKFYARIGKNKEDNCYCNYYNPECSKYSEGECIVKTKLHHPYSDIKELINYNRTYKKIHGRIREIK